MARCDSFTFLVFVLGIVLGILLKICFDSYCFYTSEEISIFGGGKSEAKSTSSSKHHPLHDPKLHEIVTEYKDRQTLPQEVHKDYQDCKERVFNHLLQDQPTDDHEKVATELDSVLTSFKDRYSYMGSPTNHYYEESLKLLSVIHSLSGQQPSE
jgi:hypothetical protein